MARLSPEGYNEIIKAAGIAQDKMGELANLFTQEGKFEQYRQEREEAKKSGEHNKYLQLDKELLATLDMIKKLEAEIVRQFNPEHIDSRRIDFIENDYMERNTENAVIDKKLKYTPEEYKNYAVDITNKIKELTEKKKKLEAEIKGLEESGKDSFLLMTKQGELKQVEEELRKADLEGKMWAKYDQKDINGQGRTELINIMKENDRVIRSNLDSMNLQGVSTDNAYEASKFLQARYGKEGKDTTNAYPQVNNYGRFSDIMEPSEINYIAQVYQQMSGKKLDLNQDLKTGKLKRLINNITGKYKKMVTARYPHLEGKDKEIEEYIKNHKNDLDLMLQVGITPEILGKAYNNMEQDISLYERNIDKRAEWLKSIIVNQPEQDRGGAGEPQPQIDIPQPGFGQPQPGVGQSQATSQTMQGANAVISQDLVQQIRNAKTDDEVILLLNNAFNSVFNQMGLNVTINIGQPKDNDNPDRKPITDPNPKPQVDPDGKPQAKSSFDILLKRLKIENEEQLFIAIQSGKKIPGLGSKGIEELKQKYADDPEKSELINKYEEQNPVKKGGSKKPKDSGKPVVGDDDKPQSPIDSILAIVSRKTEIKTEEELIIALSKGEKIAGLGPKGIEQLQQYYSSDPEKMNIINEYVASTSKSTRGRSQPKTQQQLQFPQNPTTKRRLTRDWQNDWQAGTGDWGKGDDDGDIDR